MKHRFLFVFMFVLLFLWPAPQAIAAGTPAGTGIINQAYVDYKDANGNALTRVFSAPVTTTVSQVAGVALLPKNTTTAGANDTTVHFSVDIVNTGNGDDVYNFTIPSIVGWTPDSVTFYHDVDNSHTVSAGDIEIIPVNGVYTTGTIPGDGVYPLVVEVAIPDATTAPDTTTSVTSGTVTSQFDGNVSDNGSFTIVVASAVIDANKKHIPASPAPGEIVTYTITLHNTGTSDGTAALLNDSIPIGLTYVPDSITVGGVKKTDKPGDDEADFNITSAGAVYVNTGTIDGTTTTAGGETVVITFQATVNADIPAGTNITNQAKVDYSSGGNSISETTNGDSLTVGSAPAVDLTAASTSTTGDPGDTITYAITIDNNGNAKDVIDLTFTSSQGWPWVLWLDANEDGIAGNDGDSLLIDTDGDGIIDTGSMNQNGTAAILAVTTVPKGTSNGTVDTLVIKGTSSVDPLISDTTGVLSTTVTAPVLSIDKTVSPSGSQAPGTTLTYTITVTNNGAGVATAVTITDVVPNFTTYVPKSIKTGASLGDLLLPAAVKSDDRDGDGAEFDSGSHAVVAGGEDKTLGTGGQFILEFKVTID